jgi:lysozyme
VTLNGYDISAYQGSLNPAAVPGDFVIVKATGGDGYVNPNFRAQIQAARNAGKLVGIYHFARDGYTAATAQSEAVWFIRNAGDLLDGTVLAVLDWEADNQTDVGYAKAWLDTVTAQTGVKPVIYMSFATIKAADWSSVANADYGLWEAAYVLGYQQINGYAVPGGRSAIPYWSSICMWQYTSSGYLPGWGSALDLDVFYGDASTWAAYCAKNGVILAATGTTPIPEDDMATVSQESWDNLCKLVSSLVDNAATKADLSDLPREIWSYTNPNLPGGDAYQILRDGVATTASLTDEQVADLATKLGPELIARLAAQLQK